MDIDGQRGGDQQPAHGSRSIGSIIAIVVVTALAAVWVVQNSDSVEVDWLITSAEAPLSLVIIIAAVLGWVVGSLAMYMLRRRRRSER